MSVTLYHAPPSFYSQIARLVLAEKAVPYAAKLAAPGPPLFETYQPWYIRLNPNGTIPTLVDGDVAIPDSREILAYVDVNFEGPTLTPADLHERATMERIIADLYEVSIRELSYGSDRMAKMGLRVNGLRAKQLRKLAARHPELRETYEAKLADIEGFSAAASDRSAVDAQVRRMNEVLDELDRELANQQFIVGSSYSLADVVATVTVARMTMLSQEPTARRPALASWFERMRQRPSFVAADVWDQFRPSRLIAMLLRKLGPYLLGAAVIVGLLSWALWQALR